MLARRMVRPRRLGSLLMMSIALACAAGAPARAEVLPAVTIDGPSPDVLELGGVAMAEDGTGGIVYRKNDGGVSHVFAARFDGAHWGDPQRVDVGQAYTSRWPRIGAANGGRLVVTWTQDGGQDLDGLWSATLPRGGRHFLAPTLVDYSIGEDRATYPQLVMNKGGQALLVYVALRPASPTLPSGYVNADIRIARYDGSRWTKLGIPANRNRAQPVSQLTADDTPAIAIDGTGNGVVAWQEPDDDFVNRVWARKLFGNRYGLVLAASPQKLGDTAVRGGADRIAVSETALSRFVVTYRQLPDPRDRTSAPKLYANQVDETDPAFVAGPLLIGDAGDTLAPVATAGRADTLLGTVSGGTLNAGYKSGVGDLVMNPLGPALAAPAPVVVGGDDARGVIASAGSGGGGEVLVRELDGPNEVERLSVGAGAGGPIRELAGAGTGRGDAIVGFDQGADGVGQIGASVVDTPPAPFTMTMAEGWSKSAKPLLAWDPAPDALGPVTYTVWIDGRRVARTSATSLRLAEGAIDQGQHTIRIVASDVAGQRTDADPKAFKSDRQAPLVGFAVKGRKVTVKVSDPGGSKASGPLKSGTTIDWGAGADDPTQATRSASHTYKKGRYTIKVVASDAAHNRATATRVVRITG
jgi:hypothetical protein